MKPTKVCDDCDGAGRVEVCRRHWSSNCPCWRTLVDCPTCDGSGEVEPSDADEIVGLEPGA